MAPRLVTTVEILRTKAEFARIELTEAKFEDVVASNELVLVDFWAAWCGPCRGFVPVYAKVSVRYPDAVFDKVDTEAQPGLAGAFQIMPIPTLMVIRERVILFSQAGALPEAALLDVLNRVREIDMEQILAQIHERDSAEI